MHQFFDFFKTKGVHLIKKPRIFEKDDRSLPQYPEGEHGTFVTSDCTKDTPIRYSGNGLQSEERGEAITCLDMIERIERLLPNHDMFHVESPCPKEDQPQSVALDKWSKKSYGDAMMEARRVAVAMMNLAELPMHGCVTIYGHNSTEWMLSVIATAFCGAKSSGIYPTDLMGAVKYKITHSGSSILVIDDEIKYKRIRSIINELPEVKLIICTIYTPEERTIKREEQGLGEVILRTWEEMAYYGSKNEDDEEIIKMVKARRAQVVPSTVCTLAYTSGTTGTPKAVMITHDNITSQCRVSPDMLMLRAPKLDRKNRLLSYLPLSHIAGIMSDLWFPIGIPYFHGLDKYLPAAIYFARPYDLKAGTLPFRLRAVKPTIFFGVPRIWEKAQGRLLEFGNGKKGALKALSGWAKTQGVQAAEEAQLGGEGSQSIAFKFLSGTLLKVIRKKLGLDTCVCPMTGSAPISKETLKYFGSLGISIMELYGMTESCGIASTNSHPSNIFGSIGHALEGFEIEVFKVDEKTGQKTRCPRTDDIFKPSETEQGEICFRGRHIMKGYMANPALGEEHVKWVDECNAQAIDAEGWLHSGDRGCMGKNGMFRVTGRYKEILIGAGGENIAPVPIEDYLKKVCPAISNCIVIADKKKFCSMLLTLKCEGSTGETPGTDILTGPAAAVEPSCKTIKHAVEDEKYQRHIQEKIDQYNRDPEVCVSNASKIQKFTILPEDFSIVKEEFTPTLKMRRDFIVQKYATEIEKMYA